MKFFVTSVLLFVVQFIIAQPCLIGHWPLDSNAHDISGNGFHGVIFGATPDTGRLGIANTAYRFDGVNDYIKISHDTLFDFDVNDTFSISLWVKVDQAFQNISYGGSNDIISKWQDTSNFNADYPYAIRYLNQNSTRNGKVMGVRYSRVCLQGPSVESEAKVNDGLFHHILFTRSADDSIRIYVDGFLEDVSKDVTTCSTTNILDMDFGRRGGFKNPGYFKGVIDDVKIYGCALLPSEITDDTCFIDTTLTIGSSFIASNDLNADSYQWYDCSHGFPVKLSGQTSRVMFNVSSGNYSVEITEDSCQEQTACTSFTATNSVEKLEQITFNVYPNPSEQSLVYFDLPLNKESTYLIYDSYGRLVDSGKLTENALNVESLKTGFYILQIDSEDKEFRSELIRH